MGLPLYVAQLLAKHLFVPWYLPVLGTLGAGSLLFAAIRTRGLWQLIPGVLFVLLGLLAAGEWFWLLSFSRVPTYAGPMEVGKPFPTFSTTLADGSKFDEIGLKEYQTDCSWSSFRGRW